ncbi:hypothetical protein GH714_014827 [Hevea brasiliensis]|uniref:DUF936 domain-containing protein n=1 Tax=Hevea brasiliensis TaxID=3981 RepID=A0A6A6N422_HEVBR|nr:hypothetical protein GH714_014827 [Hevea brasiliensis]
MASLTPGLLSKLLENAGNKDLRVTGEHRSALLQVLEILPFLAGPDDPWQSRGFFLKVSDSLHSAYVSVQDEDVDLIYSDKIQLGQFVYVSRLDSASPVPVLRGLKPVPKRRPCVGNPKDLVSSDMLPIRPSMNFSKQKKGSKTDGLPKKIAVDCKARRRDSLGNGTKAEGLELRRLSLDSSRRIWNQTPTPKSSSTPSMTLKSSKNFKFDKKTSSKNDLSFKRPTLSISPLKSKNEVSSPKATTRPLKKELKSTTDHAIPSCLVKLPLSSTTCSAQRISWDAVPSAIQNLGKETVHHRNVAFVAAVSALEEASAAENVILCVREFAELCKSSQNMSSVSLVEKYLDLHQNMQKAAKVINSLISDSLLEAKSSFYDSLQCLLPNARKTKMNKNAALWVHAAIETNFSKFILLKEPEKSEMVDSDKCHYVILGSIPEELHSENQSPQIKGRPRNHGNLSDASPEQEPSSWKKMDPKRMIVLKEFCMGGDSEIAYLLRQLKRVNQWLDDWGGLGVKVDGRIEDLRKKLYGFLLEHVDTAVAAVK